MTVNPTVIPATRSPTAQLLSYFGSQFRIGTLLCSIFLVQALLTFLFAQDLMACVVEDLLFSSTTETLGEIRRKRSLSELTDEIVAAFELVEPVDVDARGGGAEVSQGASAALALQVSFGLHDVPATMRWFYSIELSFRNRTCLKVMQW
jgi:hypothetical protein